MACFEATCLLLNCVSPVTLESRRACLTCWIWGTWLGRFLGDTMPVCAATSATRMPLPSWSSPRTGRSREASFRLVDVSIVPSCGEVKSKSPQLSAGRGVRLSITHSIARSFSGPVSSSHGCFTGRGQNQIMSVRGRANTRAGRSLHQSRLHGPSGRDITPGTVSLGWRNSQCRVTAVMSEQIAQKAHVALLI